MSVLLTMLIAAYFLVALAVAAEIVPRAFFTHPVERFVVRVSCGLVWPMLFGWVLACKVNALNNEYEALQRLRQHDSNVIR